MKLLLDQNLSFRIASELQDIFPGTTHIKNLKLETSSDEEIWNYAKDNSFIIVTKDSDTNINFDNNFSAAIHFFILKSDK